MTWLRSSSSAIACRSRCSTFDVISGLHGNSRESRTQLSQLDDTHHGLARRRCRRTMSGNKPVRQTNDFGVEQIPRRRTYTTASDPDQMHQRILVLDDIGLNIVSCPVTLQSIHIKRPEPMLNWHCLCNLFAIHQAPTDGSLDRVGIMPGFVCAAHQVIDGGKLSSVPMLAEEELRGPRSLDPVDLSMI